MEQNPTEVVVFFSNHISLTDHFFSLLRDYQLIADLILFANCRQEIDQLELGKHLPVLAVHISLDLVILRGKTCTRQLGYRNNG